MKNKLLLGLLLCLFSCIHNEDKALFKDGFYAVHDTHQIDKAKILIEQCDSDECRAFGNHVIADLFFLDSKFDSALTYGLESLFLYKRQENKKSTIDMYWFLGDVLQNSGNYLYSIKFYNKAFDLIPDETSEMEIKIDMARSLYYDGQIFEPRKLLKETLSFFRGVNDKLYAESNLLLGCLEYSFQNKSDAPNYNKTYQYYFKALENFDKNQHKTIVFSNIGKTYIEERKFKKAKSFLDSAMAITNDEFSKSLILFNYAMLYKETGDLTTARSWLKEFVGLNTELGFSANDAYSELIDIDIDLGRYEEAKKLNKEHKSKVNNQLERISMMENLTDEELYQRAEIQEKNDLLIQSKFVSSIIYAIVIVGLLTFMVVIINWTRPLKTKYVRSKREHLAAQEKMRQAREKLNEMKF